MTYKTLACVILLSLAGCASGQSQEACPNPPQGSYLCDFDNDTCGNQPPHILDFMADNADDACGNITGSESWNGDKVSYSLQVGDNGDLSGTATVNDCTYGVVCR